MRTLKLLSFCFVLSSSIVLMEAHPKKKSIKFQPFSTNPALASGVPFYFKGPAPFSSDSDPTIDGLPRTTRAFLIQRTRFLLTDNHLVIDDDDDDGNAKPERGRVGLGANSIPEDVDRDSRLQVCSIAKLRGYPCETHYTVTADGFILTVFRIPHGRAGPSNSARTRLPVLMHHGLMDTGTQVPCDSAGVARVLAFFVRV